MTLQQLKIVQIVEKDITTETAKEINLTSGENIGDGYKFQLLNDDNMYYGYRLRAAPNKEGSYYELIYATNADLVTNIPNNYTAIYKKNNGFIYSPYSLNSSNNNQKKEGNVELYYNNGNVTGIVYEPTNQTNKIFEITGQNNQLTITSTENISDSGTLISPRQKAAMTVQFVDSSKGASDRKYIIGTTKSTPGGNEVGFSALLFAEKQN
ncbi:hypothetical protein ACFSAV_05985 [Pasteurella oralis]|uniref:Lipoprotein n=1 Tax=Pasteurella oralis TaxID=1071947 RepID=A0ABW4NTI0_9PAST